MNKKMLLAIICLTLVLSATANSVEEESAESGEKAAITKNDAKEYLDSDVGPESKSEVNSLFTLPILYLQNVTISGNVAYAADVIMVGSNVTSLQTPGPVTFSSGTITLTAQTIELKGETTVALGTTFTAQPQ